MPSSSPPCNRRADQQGPARAQLEAARRSSDLADVTGSLRQALASHSPGASGASAWPTTSCAGPGSSGASTTPSAGPTGGHHPRLHLPAARRRPPPYGRGKFPASAYLRYLEATSDTDREQHRRQFLRDVRDRVRSSPSRLRRPPARRPATCCCSSPTGRLLVSCEPDPDVLDHAPVAAGGALLAVDAVRGPRRGTPGHRPLPPRAGVQRDPRCLGTFTRQWGVLRPARQGGPPARRQPEGVRGAVRHAATSCSGRSAQWSTCPGRQGLDELGGRGRWCGPSPAPARGARRLNGRRGAGLAPMSLGRGWRRPVALPPLPDLLRHDADLLRQRRPHRPRLRPSSRTPSPAGCLLGGTSSS